jgi:hypothetical protein
LCSATRWKRSAAIASGEQDNKALAEHPLIQDGQKLIPSVTRAFRKGQTLYMYLEACDAPQTLEASVAFYRGAQKAFEMPLSVVRDGYKPQSKAQLVKLAVPLDNLEPGRYTCQVSVSSVRAQKVAFWRGVMAVLP